MSDDLHTPTSRALVPDDLHTPTSRRADAEGFVASAFLFVVLECSRPLAGGARYGLANVDEVRIGRGPRRAVERRITTWGSILFVSVPDTSMSQSHARIKRAPGGWVLEDCHSTNGTRKNGVGVASSLLSDGDLVEMGRTIFMLRQALPCRPDDVDSEAPQLDVPGFENLATLVPAHAGAVETLLRVAASPLPVLLLGETGTGKEVLARAVHAASRRAGPFVAVNCGALPQALVEGQLFGHVRGSFSGAVRDEVGFVRAASGGTLFLDEIGDMPMSSQAALLRVLQEREVTPVGATRAVKVDLRVVAATNRPVEALKAGPDFRADLYARLACYTHGLPPLRVRKEDLGLLVASLLRAATPDRAEKITFSLDAGRAVCAYHWPFNVRELEQCVALAAVLAIQGHVGTDHLPNALRRGSGPVVSEGSAGARAELRGRLHALLTTTGGNVSHVARMLGTTRTQVHRWMRRFALDPNAYRDALAPESSDAR